MGFSCFLILICLKCAGTHFMFEKHSCFFSENIENRGCSAGFIHKMLAAFYPVKNSIVHVHILIQMAMDLSTSGLEGSNISVQEFDQGTTRCCSLYFTMCVCGFLNENQNTYRILWLFHHTSMQHFLWKRLEIAVSEAPHLAGFFDWPMLCVDMWHLPKFVWWFLNPMNTIQYHSILQDLSTIVTRCYKYHKP